MRVLVVDQDSALLTAITQLLGEYFVIDAVTTKADCLDLVRANEYDIIVAGERLEDGSGLELLGQMGRNRPDMLRIFAVERERLKLLKGRLGPFGLFRTLSYPIEPRQLLAALSAAAGVEEEMDGSEEAAPEPPPPPPARASRAPAVPSVPLEPVEVTVRSVRVTERPARESPAGTVAPVTATRVMVQASAPRARREVHDFTLVDEEPPPPPAPRPRKGGKSRSSARAASSASPDTRSGRQPTPEALAVGSRLAAASRAKAFSPPLLEPEAKRSAALVAAGIVVIIGAMAIGLHLINTADAPKFSTVSLAANQDPPEVVKLVADTEVAFQKDDFRAARTNITALQQIAPTQPRLPFFEALLAKHEAMLLNTPPPPESPRLFSRHTAPPPKTNTIAAPSRFGAFFARHTEASRVESGSALPSKPAAAPPLANASAKAMPGASTPGNYSSTFSGKTLEDSKAAEGSVVAQEPEILKRSAPEYPDDAAAKGIEGAVDLSFMVSTAGEVRDVTVVHAEPSSIFNRAAIAAVRRWKYRPRTVNGVAVESRVELRMTFKLNGR
jgi:protein TonB